MDPICLTPNCGRSLLKTENARGLCGPCYQCARRMVKMGATTWYELEGLGLCTSPIRKQTKRPPSKFETAFHEAKRKQAEETAGRK